MKKYISYSTVVLLIAILSCSKQNDVVSDLETASNKTTEPSVSALINDKPWEASNESTDSSTIEQPVKDSVPTTNDSQFYATFGSDTTSLKIFANGSFTGYEDASFAQILLWIRGFKGKGNYPLGINDSASVGVFSVVRPNDIFEQYYTGQGNLGFVNVTSYDKDKNIISGEFEFTAVSIDSTITVKKGQFSTIPFNF